MGACVRARVCVFVPFFSLFFFFRNFYFVWKRKKFFEKKMEWNFCRWVVDVPPRETSPLAKSEERRMFSLASFCYMW